MSRILILRLAGFLVISGCYGAPDDGGTPAFYDLDPCAGLHVQIVDDAVSPPANVSTVLRVTDCNYQSLGLRLASADFSLFEDDKPLPDLEAKRLIEPMDREMVEATLIVLDLSGSLSESSDRARIAESAKKLGAELIGEGHQVAVFGFDGRRELIPFAYFTSDEVELAEALEKLTQASVVDESTNLYGAVLNGLEMLDEATDRLSRDDWTITHGSLVVMSDGYDLASRSTKEEVEAALEKTEHSTFAIGVGAALDHQTLRLIGQTASFDSMDTEEVVRAFERVREDIRALAQRDYLISYCSPARNGEHLLKVTVEYEGLKGSAFYPFTASGFDSGCDPTSSPVGL